MQQIDQTAAINAIEEQVRQATLQNDIAAHERLLTDDWLVINGNGSVTTRAQLLAMLRDRPFAFHTITDDDVLLRIYETTAIVTGRSTRVFRGRDDAMISQHVRFTRVYVCQDGLWRLASAQTTPADMADVRT